MTLPIRPAVHVLTAEVPDEIPLMTIREAIEWFKNAVRKAPGDLSAMERKELDGMWAHIAGAIAKREGIPDGSLSYFMGELAQTEMRLAETVSDEAHAAGIDYVPE